MIEYSASQQAEFPEDKKFAARVLGVGGAGTNVLDRIALEGSEDAELMVLNTDGRSLSTSVSGDRIQLGKNLLKGMGAGGDPELGQQSALEAVDEIRHAVRGQDMVFVCVGLGGGTGSGAGPEVCRIAREEGVFLVVFATMPFSFEGRRRTLQANEALEKISKYANAVVTFENDRMGELVLAKEGVQQAFAAADRLISQSIRATMNIVLQPGLIRIGMDDLLAALRNRDSRCLFGHGQAKGENRALDALDVALKSPLLEKGDSLKRAKNVLVHVSGGENLTMAEVEMLMNELSGHISDHTQILFGTSTDKKMGNSLSVTVFSSLAASGDDPDDDKLTPPSLVTRQKLEDQHGNVRSTSPLAGAAQSLAHGNPEPPPASLSAPQTVPALAEIEPEQEPSWSEIEAVDEIADLDQAEIESIQPNEPPITPVAETPPPQLSTTSDLSPQIGVRRPVNPNLTRPVTAPRALSRPEEAAPPALRPRPLTPFQETEAGGTPAPPHPGMRQPVSIRDLARQRSASPTGADRVEAELEGEQTISLSPIAASIQEATARGEAAAGSAPTLRRLKTPPVGGASAAPEVSPLPVLRRPPPMPEPVDDEIEHDEPPTNPIAAQQQALLQLEPLSKGRFAKAEPTIEDGQDLDVPTFLRRRRK